jgi:glycogen phosphorylase
MSPCGAVEGGLLYAAAAPASRPADHYTPRVIPRHEAAFIPAENRLIAWQK